MVRHRCTTFGTPASTRHSRHSRCPQSPAAATIMRSGRTLHRSAPHPERPLEALCRSTRVRSMTRPLATRGSDLRRRCVNSAMRDSIRFIYFPRFLIPSHNALLRRRDLLSQHLPGPHQPRAHRPLAIPMASAISREFISTDNARPAVDSSGNCRSAGAPRPPSSPLRRVSSGPILIRQILGEESPPGSNWGRLGFCAEGASAGGESRTTSPRPSASRPAPHKRAHPAIPPALSPPDLQKRLLRRILRIMRPRSTVHATRQANRHCRSTRPANSASSPGRTRCGSSPFIRKDEPTPPTVHFSCGLRRNVRVWPAPGKPVLCPALASPPGSPLIWRPAAISLFEVI